MLTQAYAHQCFAYAAGPYKDPNTKHKHGGLKRGSGGTCIVRLFKWKTSAYFADQDKTGQGCLAISFLRRYTSYSHVALEGASGLEECTDWFGKADIPWTQSENSSHPKSLVMNKNVKMRNFGSPSCWPKLLAGDRLVLHFQDLQGLGRLRHLDLAYSGGGETNTVAESINLMTICTIWLLMATGNTYDLSTPPISFSLAHDLRSGNTYEKQRHQIIWSWQTMLDLEDAPFVSVELMTMASGQMGYVSFQVDIGSGRHEFRGTHAFSTSWKGRTSSASQ